MVMQLMLSNRVNRVKPSATLGMAQAARELASSGIDVVIMSAGEPDFTTPKVICDVAKKAIDEGKTHYVPVAGTGSMIKAMQEKFLRDQKVSYSPSEVICTVGAKSALLMALQAIVNDGDEVIIFAPYWVSYYEQIRFVSGKPVIVTCQKEDNFFPKLSDLKRAITDKTKAIILNSPNNPSGAVISKAQLLELSEFLKGSNIWVISDEIYEKLLFDGREHISPASLNEDMRERTIVISGVAKAYAMTGWRVGVAAGNSSIISAMTKLQGQQTTCLPEFIQDAAAFALKENDEVKAEINKMVEAYRERRDLAVSLFKKLPKVIIFPSQGAFYVWADFSYYIGKMLSKKVIMDDIDLAIRMLKEAHVASVPGAPFGGPGFLRFSIASSKKDIREAVERLERWLSQSCKDT